MNPLSLNSNYYIKSYSDFKMPYRSFGLKGGATITNLSNILEFRVGL